MSRFDPLSVPGPSKVLQNGLSFLKEFGFGAPQIKTESSKLTGSSLIMKYESKKNGRKIEVSYLRQQRDLPSTIVVFIISEEGKMFSLEDWLNAKGKEQAVRFILRNDSNISEDVFLTEFTSSLENLCLSDLRDIIDGRSWESIPFDWKGYK